MTKVSRANLVIQQAPFHPRAFPMSFQRTLNSFPSLPQVRSFLISDLRKGREGEAERTSRPPAAEAPFPTAPADLSDQKHLIETQWLHWQKVNSCIKNATQKRIVAFAMQ
jgi:hypothetical protein